MSPPNIRNDPDVQRLLKARREAFTSLDEKKIRAYMIECNIPTPSSNEVFWKGVHMARAAMVDIAMELREKSIDWMIDNSTLFSFISDTMTQDEKKEHLMHFYEVRYGNKLDS
jgi:hypothetical protein